jgi:hypothetical protein
MSFTLWVGVGSPGWVEDEFAWQFAVVSIERANV